MAGGFTGSGGGGGGGTPSNTVVSSKVSNQAAAAGVSAEYSRGDHVHGSLDKATTVVGPGTFGSAPVVGASTTKFAPEDHFHGLPTISPAEMTGGFSGGITVACGDVACVGASLVTKHLTITVVNGVITAVSGCA